MRGPRLQNLKLERKADVMQRAVETLDTELHSLESKRMSSRGKARPVSRDFSQIFMKILDFSSKNHEMQRKRRRSRRSRIASRTTSTRRRCRRSPRRRRCAGWYQAECVPPLHVVFSTRKVRTTSV